VIVAQILDPRGEVSAWKGNTTLDKPVNLGNGIIQTYATITIMFPTVK
jgi:hypothetical protein